MWCNIRGFEKEEDAMFATMEPLHWTLEGVHYSLIPKQGKVFHFFVTKPGEKGIKGEVVSAEAGINILLQALETPGCEPEDETMLNILELGICPLRPVSLEEAEEEYEHQMLATHKLEDLDETESHLH